MTVQSGSVLVGFGHAAQNLHLQALRELGVRSVAAVDPSEITKLPLRGVPVFPDLGSYFARATAVDRAYFHVAVGAGRNAEIAGELITRGARRIIVEKPLAADAAQASRLYALARSSGARLSAVAVWPHSSATQTVRQALRRDQALTIEFVQNKPRAVRSASDTSHRDALEIEMPHQVLLAIVLAGPVESVEEAAVWHVAYEGRVLPGMGGAQLVLRHRNGSRSFLSSDLTSPVRERVLRVSDGTSDFTVWYPTSVAVGTSEVRDNVTGERRLLTDRPFTSYLRATYRQFADEMSAEHEVLLQTHMHAFDVIATARAQALAQGV